MKEHTDAIVSIGGGSISQVCIDNNSRSIYATGSSGENDKMWT